METLIAQQLQATLTITQYAVYGSGVLFALIALFDKARKYV